MYCSHCGAQIPDGAAFCSNCGKPVAAPVAAPVEEVVETVAEQVEPVIEAVEAAPEAAQEAVENAAESVEDALERLKAEMAAAGELSADAAAPAAEPAAEPAPEPIVLEPVAIPEPIVLEPVVVPEPVAEAAPAPEPVSIPAPVEPAPAPAPAPAVAPVAPVAPVAHAAAPAEPAAYVEPVAPVQPTTVNPAYTEPTTISAPVTPAETAAYAAPAASYTAPAPQAYTTPAPQQTYTPPTPVAQQPAGYSYQPAATAPAAAAPVKKSPVAKIAIAAVALALVGFLLFMAFGRGGNSGGGNSGGGNTPAVTPAGDYELLDSKGNPTVYSIFELDGSDLVDTIEGEGFEWTDSNKWWVSEDGNDAFYVSSNNDYEYLYDEITSLGVNGKGDSCVYVIVVDDRDYSSAEDAFNKLCNIEVLDVEWLDDDLGLAAVESPSGRQGMVLVNVDDEVGLYILNVINEEGVASGLLDEYIGDDYGSSVPEVWENLFDRSIGSYTGTVSTAPTLTAPSVPTVGTLSEGALGSIAPGTYLVGEGLEPGEYKLYADPDNMGYYALYEDDSSTDFDNMINSEVFDSCCYVTLKEGQYIELEDCSLDPIASAKPASNLSMDGVYKAGVDFPAGTVTLNPTDDDFEGFYAILGTADPLDEDNYYLEVEMFDDPVQIEVKEGQYLSTSFCSIEV